MRPLRPIGVTHELLENYTAFRNGSKDLLRLSQVDDSAFAQSFFEQIEDISTLLSSKVIDLFSEAMRVKLLSKSASVMATCNPDQVVIVDSTFAVRNLCKF